jgi:hypothetical protein
MPKRNTRDYGKFHPRFFQGGAVPPDPAELERWSGERASREGLAFNREHAINKLGRGRPEDYEQRPEQSIIKKPDEALVIERDPNNPDHFRDI